LARHNDSGRIAEELARRYLLDHGLKTVTTNYRCHYGELDLIMHDRKLLIVVEIRYRHRSTFGGPIASISPAKRRKIATATQHFMHSYPAYRNVPVRFDVIGLTGMLHAPDINWIAGAFTMDDLTDT
jgi:putative endonuclease